MQVRPATPEEVPAITALVARAFAPYIPRIGRRPGPMDDDYGRRVADGQVLVVRGDDAAAVLGVLVLTWAADHVHVDAVAVDPAHHGTGIGRALLRHAEAEARRAGHAEVRLSTNAKMTENLALYPRAGYERTGRSTVGPFDRVHFRKRLSGGGPAR